MIDGMLRTVIGVEARRLLHDLVAIVAVTTFALCAIWAALAGAGRVAADRSLDMAAVAAADARLAALSEGGADTARAGRELVRPVAVLPPRPLAALVEGGGGLEIERLELTTGPTLDVANAGRLDAEGAATGALDLGFLWVHLLPLLVIALTYDLLAGERESGTLAIVLSHPVRLRTFLFGKALTRALVVGAVIIAATGVAVIAGAELGGARTVGELSLLLGLVTGWAACWFAAALAVNALGRTAAGNALALVGLWLLTVVVAPGLVRVVVEAVHPPPSRVQAATLAREAGKEIAERLATAEGQHGGQDARGATERSGDESEELVRRVAPVLESFDAQLALQQELVDTLRFISPAIVVSEGLVELAGAGVSRRADFIRQCRDHQAELRRWFAEHAKTHELLAPGALAGMPRFVWHEPPATVTAARVGGGLLALLATAAALLALAVWRLHRRDGL